MGKHCGAEGSWKSKFIPDEFKVPGSGASAKFYRACDKHDDCYDTLGASKDDCDNGLHANLRKECKIAYKGLNKVFLPACYTAAFTFYEAVHLSPDSKEAYKKAQDAARSRGEQIVEAKH